MPSLVPLITDTIRPNRKDEDLTKGRFVSEDVVQFTTFDNNSTYDYVSIFTGMAKLKTIFDESPDEDDYLENALNCLRQIKNVRIELYGFKGFTDENGEICLPERATQIEYVTNGETDWFSSSYNNQLSQLFANGTMIAYKFLGNKLITDLPKNPVSVAYWAHKQDEEGLPLITEQEAEACAYWWIWVDARRKFRKGNPLAAQYLEQARRDKNKAINQAKVPQHLSQNFVNQVANILYSRDRKTYNYSYTPVKLA